MQKARKKSAPKIKKTKTNKKRRKIITKKTLRRTQGKTKKQNIESDVIFDSKINKTDALFVDNPKIVSTQSTLISISDIPVPQPPEPIKNPLKKSFWQKILFFKK